MKDYKLLLTGLILLLIFFIAIFTWLWLNNRKNIDPLPVMANENEPKVMAEDDDESAPSNIPLHIQAEESLQSVLEEVIVRFESRYPHIKVMTNYVATPSLLTLSDAVNGGGNSDFVVGTDMIIANDSLSTAQLAPLQAEIKSAQDNKKQNEASSNKSDADNEEPAVDDKTGMTQTYNTETRTLNSYSYALNDDQTQTLEGVILTDNTAAINFRNFLLSSTGQDILKAYDYQNIEGYRNSVDDLFNPTSRSKKPSNDSSVDVSDALSNGKS
ncbi:hypothetical protein AAJP47_08065 [Psychrobacter sp. B38]|uniref:hypothetical protein n=1 Tax=Psychrobacter sp. B38 TaxID=3143538 RepID=UPI00320F6F9E